MVLTLNLESGMPTVAVAKNRLTVGLRSAKTQRIAVVKLIHGYGSSGTGGRIRTQVHRTLAAMKTDGTIREYVPGEAFTPFEESARHAITLCPELARDHDYLRCNQGITVVIL